MPRPLLLSLFLFAPCLSHAAGDAVAGKAAFAKCLSCHQVGESARGAYGPQLNGLFGRRAGSTPDYNYSPAMKKSGIVWSDTTLAAFIRSPSAVVPGTKMSFWGIGNEQQISNLLAYLKTF